MQLVGYVRNWWGMYATGGVCTELVGYVCNWWDMYGTGGVCMQLVGYVCTALIRKHTL